MTAAAPTRLVWDRAATAAMFAANGFAFGIWAGNVPRLREAQGLSDAALGVLLFAISVGAVLPMPLTGWLAARLGASRVAAGAGVLLAMALCLPAVLPGGVALLGGAAFLGVAIGLMDVSLNAHAAAVERDWGAPIMSSFHAGWSLGGLAGAAAAGALAGMGADLVTSFLWPALLLGAVSLLGFTLRLRADPAGGKLAWPTRALLGIATVAALCFLAEGAIGDWSGVYLRTVLGSDPAWASSAYAGYAVAMAAGRLTGDVIVGRFGAKRVVRWGGALAAIGLAAALAAPGVAAADAGMVLVGFGLSNIVPIAFSAAARAGGTAGIAMAASTGYAGFMVGPPVIGATAELVGLRLALLLVLAAVTAMSLLARAVAPGGSDAPLANGSHPAGG